jgi:hypothetical protein
MRWITRNRYDDSTKALLRSTEPRTRSRVSVGAGGGDAPFPVGIFAAIIAAGILGGTAATYFERFERRGYRR